MTNPYGLGALESPPDRRDFQIDQAFAAAGILPSTPPPSYDVARLPPVASFDQGSSPKCVSYSNSIEQASFDLADLGHNFKWDFNLFFRRIGGTANGAIPRVALAERLHRGIPLLPSNSGNSAASHRIGAYYSVPKTKLAIQQTIQAFRGVLISTPWFNSWFYPNPDGTLPDPDYLVGGHEFYAPGWRPEGLRGEQTWGADFADHGFFVMPWEYVLHAVREVWKATDRITPKGPTP